MEHHLKCQSYLFNRGAIAEFSLLETENILGEKHNSIPALK